MSIDQSSPHSITVTQLLCVFFSTQMAAQALSKVCDDLEKGQVK
jgi:hypothetical protein